jgi:hypothetical protein
MEVNGEHHTLAALPPGKHLPVPLYNRLGGPQKRSGRYGAAKNLLPLLGIDSARSLVVIPTELSRFPDTVYYGL